MPAGDKGVFGKGKASLTVAGVSLPDSISRPVDHKGPKFTATRLRTPQTTPGRGIGRGDFILSREQRPTPRSTGKNVADAMPQVEQAGEIFGTGSTSWDIELEDGILPSDSSSLACGASVVVDTGKMWNLQERTEQPLQTAVDPYDGPRFLTTRIPDESSRSSPHVASRFFPKRAPGSSLRGDTPRTSTSDQGDPPNWGPVATTSDYYLDSPRPDVGWDRSLGANLDLGDCCEMCFSPLAARQELMTGWSDTQGFGASSAASMNSEGNNPRPRGPSSGLGCEVLSDQDRLEQVHCFSEGRRLLLGV